MSLENHVFTAFFVIISNLVVSVWYCHLPFFIGVETQVLPDGLPPTVIRSILDRLIYDDSYDIIDSNLTDGNVGCRKNRSSRDNIYVMGAIINSVVNGDSKPIQVQVMDIKTCFDKLWLEASINSLYEHGLQNDKLNLLYIENKHANVAIKVNRDLTEAKVDMPF